MASYLKFVAKAKKTKGSSQFKRKLKAYKVWEKMICVCIYAKISSNVDRNGLISIILC